MAQGVGVELLIKPDAALIGAQSGSIVGHGTQRRWTSRNGA